MAGYRKKNADGPNSEDKALDLFAEMMIEKIEGIQKDWKKPWFTEGALQWPRNLHGREYNGMNAFMLLLHCEKEGYKIPRFCTFDCVQKLNKSGKDGEELPRVSVLRGEKSFPVMLTTFTCIHKETKEKIKYDDYKKLSDDEKEQYNVYPKMQVFRVFNVAQTNLQEARPELWQKLEQENSRPAIEEGEHYSFAPVDTMIRDNLWICPITPKYQNDAYYSITKNEIIVPEKEQFRSGESFYGTLFHEMTHSTGAEGVLDRFKPTTFGSPEYAREELVAELGSALVAQRYGMTKHIKEESCAYLKGWLDELKESPQFIKTTLLDVKRATSIITQKVDKIAQELEQNVGEKQENGAAAGVALTFGHRLSQIEIKAKNTNDGYVYKVQGVRIGQPVSKATFDFGTTSWQLGSVKTNYEATYAGSEKTLTGTAASIMAVEDDNAMLIPQQLIAWTPDTDKTNTNKGAYLAVKVNITTKDGARVYPSVGEYDWVAVAVNTKWEPGQKYVYTLDFSNGAGKVDPEKPMPGPTDPFKPGEDVLGSAIKFTVTVTPWTSASENVPM